MANLGERLCRFSGVKVQASELRFVSRSDGSECKILGSWAFTFHWSWACHPSFRVASELG